MKDIIDFLNESKGQRISMRKSNKPYDANDDKLVHNKETRNDRADGLKIQKVFNKFVENIKSIYDNREKYSKYFSNIIIYNLDHKNDKVNIFDNKFDINKLNLNNEKTIFYDDKSLGWLSLFYHKKEVSFHMIIIALEFNENYNIDENYAKSVIKQYSKGKDDNFGIGVDGSKRNKVYYVRLKDLAINDFDIDKFVNIMDDVKKRW